MTSTFPPLLDSDFQIDLYKDLGDMCLAELQTMGYKNVTATDPELLCEQYLNALYRRVSIQRRKFHQAKELTVPVGLEAGFQLLKKNVEDGEDLTPHLSGLLDKLDFNDPLLNAWKIHHFHLGTSPYAKNPSLIDRTGPILLAMVQEYHFYAIAIIPHGKYGNPDVFFDQDLIEILHQNFPEMMLRYKLNGKAASPKPTNAEVKMLRDAGITQIPQTNDGTLYLPTAGFTSIGGTTKHTGAQIVMDTMKIIRSIKRLEKVIREKISILEICFSKGGNRPYKISLTGFLNNGYASAREESSYVGMKIDDFKSSPGAECLNVWLETRPQV